MSAWQTERAFIGDGSILLQCAYEQLIGAKSVEQVFEIQSQYAKKAYDTYIAEVSKLGEMYVGLARNAYAPMEQAAAKAAQKAN